MVLKSKQTNDNNQKLSIPEKQDIFRKSKIMEKGEWINGCMIVYLQTGRNVFILLYEKFYTGFNITTDLCSFLASSGVEQG